MQKKSDTFAKFCEFKALVEKESGKKVIDLRIDNDGEFISAEFKEFCSAEGFGESSSHPITHSRTGWLSGRTERSWVLHRRCCMIRAYPFTCGLRHAIQQCMCRTVVLTRFLA